jgi:hypothetical protein
MGIFRATLVVAVLAAGTTAAEYIRLPGTVGVVDETQNYITREWRWSEDGTSWTVFTAFGPPEQVNAFDPRDGDGPLRCPDCRMASSTQVSPGDAVNLAREP